MSPSMKNYFTAAFQKCENNSLRFVLCVHFIHNMHVSCACVYALYFTHSHRFCCVVECWKNLDDNPGENSENVRWKIMVFFIYRNTRIVFSKSNYVFSVVLWLMIWFRDFSMCSKPPHDSLRVDFSPKMFLAWFHAATMIPMPLPLPLHKSEKKTIFVHMARDATQRHTSSVHRTYCRDSWDRFSVWKLIIGIWFINCLRRELFYSDKYGYRIGFAVALRSYSGKIIVKWLPEDETQRDLRRCGVPVPKNGSTSIMHLFNEWLRRRGVYLHDVHRLAIA